MSNTTREQAAEEETKGADPPTARIKKLGGLSWVWIVPLAALGLVAFLAYSYWASRGPLITVTFDTAEGLSAQQTQVKYKAVSLGTVENVTLNEDRSKVVAKIRMDERAEPMLTEQTRFWVVRPRLSGNLSALQSGLQTLVSGAYVAIDPGTQKNVGKSKKHFEGLENPPNVRSDQPGTAYFLESNSLGSLGTGSPLYYRGVNVGEVLSYQLLPDANRVRVRIFVQAPYDERIANETRFWTSSGISIETGAQGLDIKLESIRSALGGGISFRTPPQHRSGEPAAPETAFQLYESRSAASVGFYDDSSPYVSYFQGSVRGLTLGSDVRMHGKAIGAVTDVTLAGDPRPGHEGEFAVRVAFVLQPARAVPEGENSALDTEEMRAFVQDDVRVVLETSNFLTGQKILSLRRAPGEAPRELGKEGEALVLPSQSGGIGDLTSSMASIASQIERIPFEQIGENLNRTLIAVEGTVGGPELKRAIVSLDATLKEAQALVREARSGMKPAFERLPRIAAKLEKTVNRANEAFGRQGYGPDSTVQRNMERMMDQVAEAARSIQLLADYLSRHPEAVIRGRRKDSP